MKKIVFFTTIFFSLYCLDACKRPEKENDGQKLITRMDTLSYVLGTKIGETYKNQNLEINPEAMFRGIKEVLEDCDTLLTDSQKQRIIDDFNMELTAVRDEQIKKLIEENKGKGEVFLRENSKKQGVVVLPGGLQYVVVREGNGFNPLITDSISVHYRLSYIDNTIIEETYNKQPSDIVLKNLNKGLAEGITLMKTGAIYDFYIPSYLAFGDTTQYDTEGNVMIPGGSTLIYHVELLKIHRIPRRVVSPGYYPQQVNEERE